MPYLHSVLNHDEAVKDAFVKRHFSEAHLDVLHHVEIWCSKFTDPGPDFSTIKAYDKEGALLASHRIEGY